MPDVHSKLPPSSAERYIHCPPSIKLGEEYGPPDTSSEYTREGTDAHTLCEFLLKEAIGEAAEDPREGLSYYDQEMEEAAQGYRDTVMELYDSLKRECPDPFLAVEQRVRFEEYVPGGFGTSDAILIGAGKMYVVDFKYGRGVEVSAKDNAQLKCYALGAYLAFGDLYDISDVTLVIYQPRIGNYSTWEFPVSDLLAWAKDVLKPAAELAAVGAGEFSCGSWCRFCKAKAVCRKRAEENLSLARYDFARPETLEEDEINIILSKVDSLVSWAEDIKTYALEEAIKGRVWDDWKVVEGRSVRKYSDEAAAAAKAIAAGIDPYEKKLIPITGLEKLMGKKKFNELLGPLIVKPAGKPTLVPRSDKRQELSNAISDFKEEN